MKWGTIKSIKVMKWVAIKSMRVYEVGYDKFDKKKGYEKGCDNVDRRL